MSLGGRTLGVVLTSWAASLSVLPAAANDFAGWSADARYVAQWVRDSGDNNGAPFAIVDKKEARLFVFDAAGRVIGTTPALLGLAPGDDAVSELGDRDPWKLRPTERTTPAGRFESEPGRNHAGEPIVWVDYDAALAIHRLRPGKPGQRLGARLASPSPADNRISLGCVVVPVAFYQTVIDPTLGQVRGVVYVLPETRAAHAMFGPPLKNVAVGQ